MKHTFASSSRHLAPCRLLFVILGIFVVNEDTCKDACNVECFHAKGNTFSIGHFLLSGFFVLKAASFPNAGCFYVSDACNPDACDQRSISILG
jgi:hypothetical protein